MVSLEPVEEGKTTRHSFVRLSRSILKYTDSYLSPNPFSIVGESELSVLRPYHAKRLPPECWRIRRPIEAKAAAFVESWQAC